ncbi:hypothetical protein [Catellatospora sp. NPDC049609]
MTGRVSFLDAAAPARPAVARTPTRDGPARRAGRFPPTGKTGIIDGG